MRLRVRICAALCNVTPTFPIFAAGSGFDLGSHGATDLGFCRPCEHSRRTLNYTALPAQFPRLSLCLSRSTRPRVCIRAIVFTPIGCAVSRLCVVQCVSNVAW